MGASVPLVGRARVVFVSLAATLVCAGGASAAPGWTDITITASDATPLACAYIIPSGTAPAGGWPGVILFHGRLGCEEADTAVARRLDGGMRLGGDHADHRYGELLL